MSVFSCDVVEILGFGNHPDADRLSITQIYGNPVIFRKGDFAKGDKAVYIPVDSVVNVTRPEFAFLKKKDGREWERIKAMKLRGIYSEGLLVPVPPELANAQPGFDAQTVLDVRKYEEPIHGTIFGGDQAPDPGFMPAFDVEPYGKNKRFLVAGERVIVTEKLHGTNARYGLKDGEFHVGSHHTFKRYDPDNLYWKVAIELGLDAKMRYFGYNNMILYGEIFGWVQDLRYGAAPNERWFRAFAVYDATPGARKWLDYEDFVKFTDSLGVERVPVLYDGPYDPAVVEPLQSGTTAIGNHLREGIVIVPAVERWEQRVGRVAFKLVSPEYKLRKDGTEHH